MISSSLAKEYDPYPIPLHPWLSTQIFVVTCLWSAT